MRILTFVPRLDLNDGGVVRAVIDIANALVAQGISVCLLCEDSKDRDELDPSVELQSLDMGTVSGSQNAIRVEGLIRDADVVHLHQVWLPANVYLSKLADQLNTPVVLSPHGMLDNWSLRQKRLKKRAFLALYRRHFRKRISLFHCTAEAEKQQLTKNLGVDADHVAVVPLFIDPNLLSRPSNRIHDDSTRSSIAFLSRVHPKKGLEILIEAMGLIKSRGIETTLRIAGPGDQRYVNRLKDLVRRLGLEDRIRFEGMIRGDDKLAFLDRSSVFVLPTHQENFGLVLIEAMLRGVPTITTRGTDIWKELESANALITRQDAAGVADAIATVLANTENWSPNRRMLTDWLDQNTLVRQYSRLYERALRAA